MFEEVYKLVKEIPEGKVVTYGQLAKMVGTRDARKIGWALHANRDPKTPCHRVVNQEGRLAPNFAFHLPSINRTSRRIRISKACCSTVELKSREGRLGGDGAAEQRRRLLDEGVKFKDEMYVDLAACRWRA